MGGYVAGRVIQLMAKKRISISGAEVLIMGITFKENFSDVRNSRVVDIVHELEQYPLTITIFDPIASPSAVKNAYDLVSEKSLTAGKKFDAIIVSVDHAQFASFDYPAFLKKPGVLFDVKGNVKNEMADGKL